MPSRRAVQKQEQKPGLPTWVIGAGIAALVVIAGIALFVIQTPRTTPIAPSSGPSAVTAGRTKGSPDAKVELIEFSDFQWPYCKDFAIGAERRIDELYLKTGKVKFTYRYYPVVDMASQRVPNESYWSAYAAECANEQGKFWEYHDKLFSEWRGEYKGTFTKTNLKKFAEDLKLDTAKFNTCVDTDRTKPVIDAEIAEARRLGIQGTPTFLVNGKLLEVRSLDASEFARVFDLLLK